jgi:hypothetical protein
MKNFFQTSPSRVSLYMNENAGWQKTLEAHYNEIPALEKLLGETMLHADGPEEEEIITDVHFRQQLVKLQEDIKSLNNELNMQQLRLADDSKKQVAYDTHALCSQDILRDRIKEVEKNHIELKCNFMRFISGII